MEFKMRFDIDNAAFDDSGNIDYAAIERVVIESAKRIQEWMQEWGCARNRNHPPLNIWDANGNVVGTMRINANPSH